jgi:hypothetical protein
VYNTYETWAEQTGYSVRQLKTVVAKLRQENVLVVANHNKRGYDRTLWYRVNYEVLAEQMSHGKCPIPSGHNVPMDSAKTAPPIPEKNSEMIPQVSSVVPDAFEKEQENQTGKTGKEVKKEAGSKLVMNAKEILDNPAWKEAQEARLHSLWLKHTGEVMGEYQKGLSIKQMSQLKMFAKSWKDNAPGALVYAVHNWNRFAVAARAARGLESTPLWPDIGFMLEYGDVLMSLLVQSLAPVKLDPPPKKIEVVETKPDIYVPQPGDLEKALEMFK